MKNKYFKMERFFILIILLISILSTPFYVAATEGYLDYKMVSEEISQYMKFAPDERHTQAGISVFEGHRSGKQWNYFSDLMERIRTSTAGPEGERVAMYVACERTADFFFYRGRVYEHNSVICGSFHRRVREYLANQTIDGFDFSARICAKQLLDHWDKRSEKASKKIVFGSISSWLWSWIGS